MYMKKNLYCFLWFAALVCTGCYKDLSTEATQHFPDIVIEGDGGTLNAVYGSVLSIEPSISQEGYTEEDFGYLWEVDLTAQKAKGRIELANTRKLEYQIGQSPSNAPYTLTLTVTNKVLGFSTVATWDLYVTSSLGEGLLVAHTRDGGISSELDLISASPVTYGYTGSDPLYARNLYSLANGGRSIEGRVNAMTARVASDNAVFNESRILIGTGSSLISIDPLTYKEDKRNDALFNLYDHSEFDTQDVFNFAAYLCDLIIDNRLYANVTNGENSFNAVALNVSPDNFFYKENTAYHKTDGSMVCTFNANDGNFYAMRGWLSMVGSMTRVRAKPSFPARGAVSLGAGGFNGNTFGFIIRDAGGVHHFCIVDAEADKIDDYPINDSDLDRTVDCAFCDNAHIAYYATPEKIHVITLSGNQLLTAALSWKPDSGEEQITSIDQYYQAWYGTQHLGFNDYSFPLNTNRMQIIITTYNPNTGEGKVYLRPFNINTGKFTFSSNGTYAGFGRITAITATLR